MESLKPMHSKPKGRAELSLVFYVAVFRRIMRFPESAKAERGLAEGGESGHGAREHFSVLI